MPIPYHELAKEFVRLRVGEQQCLYPLPGNAQCSGTVIEAHSISRNAALTKIAREHKVYQLELNPFRIDKAEGEPQLKLVYIKSATTFTGFCSAHDSKVFRPIDQGNLIPTREQVLLLHYRSLCRELYVKRPTLKMNELAREADRGKPANHQKMVQSRVTAWKTAITDALDQLAQDKMACDHALASSDFSVLQGAYVRFRKTPSLACAGYSQPTFDFEGNEVQDMDDMTNPFFNLSFNLLPDDVGGIAVFSWLPNADAICRPFVQSFMAVNDDRKSDALVQYVFDSFDNFAAEPTWWEYLAESAKSELKMNIMNGTEMSLWYDTGSLLPSTSRFADWEVVGKGWL